MFTNTVSKNELTKHGSIVSNHCSISMPPEHVRKPVLEPLFNKASRPATLLKKAPTQVF